MANLNDLIKTYATYSELFGIEYDVNKLAENIFNLPSGGIFNLLSQFNAIQVDDPRIRAHFIPFLNATNNNNEVMNKIENYTLYSRQGLLSVWKWLLAYVDKNKLNLEVEINRGINQILYINLIVSDLMYDKERKKLDIKYELFSNMAFNSQEDIGSSLTRACIIFFEVGNNKKLFNQKEFLNINSAFFNRYNYTLKEYLAILFALISGFIKTENKIDSKWNRSSNYFSNTKIPEIANKIVKELSVSFSEAKEWSKDYLREPWNFSLFRQKPIIMLDNGNYYPISLKFLYEQFFSELYFKIRNSFPKNNTNIISFYGRCFEKYVEVLSDYGVKNSRIPYIFYPEFKYGKSNISPDILIKLNNKLLVIEAKVYRLKMDSIIGSNNNTIDDDISKMAVSPILQANKRIAELKDINHESVKDVDEFYFMSVTFGPLPTLEPFEKEIHSRLTEICTIPIKSFYHLDIEEFEFLIELMSRKNPSPIFKYLDNKTKFMPHLPFKNYLFLSNLHPRRSNYIQKKLNKYAFEFQKILFDCEDEV